MKKHLLSWALTWGFITLVLFIAVPDDKASLLLGIAFAALLSLIIMLSLLLQQYSGTIQDIFQKTHSSTDEDGYTTKKTVTYAKLLLDNGKSKTIPYQKDWQKGDKLQKLRWQYQVTLLK